MLIFLIVYFLSVQFIFNLSKDSFGLMQSVDKINFIEENRNFGVGKTKLNKINVDKLDGIVGLKDVKKELIYYFDFLVNSHKYYDWKIKVPAGILLVGPPGTGKTLLVKTIAKSSNIPVLYVSASSFIQIYVGVGASRIRSLFEKARSYKKCIIFIDEIDAIGKSRGSDHNSERDQTLNQLLTELDGFRDSNSNEESILVFAATNFGNNLDKALTRSGRFDKKIYFDPPNFEERIDIFKLYIHSSDSYEKDLDYDMLGELSTGLTGADISNVVNQAKINAIKEEKISINNTDLIIAIDEVMIGREKPERKMTDMELEKVAYHEAGHAVMSLLINEKEPPIKVSIVPRGESALGFTMPKPKDVKLHSKNYLLGEVLILLSGRGAEKIFYSEYSSGSYDDIQKVTNILRTYYKSFGMSEKHGPLNYDDNEPNSIKIASINSDISEFSRYLENLTFNILNDNKEKIIIIANLLLDRKTINYKEIKNAINDSTKLDQDFIENSLNVSNLIDYDH